MANFEPAVQITLRNEGGFFHNRKTGEIVNRGVTLAFVRDCGYKADADEAYIQNLSEEEAKTIYRRYFWERYHIGDINDQALANKVFDLTVNMGPGGRKRQGGISLLQKAVKACGGQCDVDGILGPVSLGQINALDPVQLLIKYREVAGERYKKIAAANTNLAENLNGWLARLDA